MFLRRLAAAALVTLTVLTSTAFSKPATPYPLGPDQDMTPGSLCSRPDEHRYPEKIAYCSRSVDTSLKNEIIQDYNNELGYDIRKEERSKYKIDHFYPLCMGGSNEKDNLWPQHETVYTKTDMIEHVGCQKMAEGKLRQEDAIEFVREAKLDLSKAAAVLQKIQSL